MGVGQGSSIALARSICLRMCVCASWVHGSEAVGVGARSGGGALALMLPNTTARGKRRGFSPGASAC